MESAENKDEQQVQVKDIIHEHHKPLVLCKEERDESQRTNCSVCGHQLSGERYSCDECNFHVHKQCGESPSQITHHPLHKNCQQKLFTVYPYPIGDFLPECEVCWNPIYHVGYGCSSCKFYIHIDCALESLNGLHLKPEFHPHHMLLNPNLRYEQKDRRCDFCGELLLDSSMYVCVDRSCTKRFHKNCAESPIEIRHPCHRNHSLLLSQDSKTCHLCHKYRGPYGYSCSPCDFWVHPKCILEPNLVIEDKKHHQHPFNLLWRHHPFICDACGLEGNCASYVCVSCHITLHKKCISLPRFMKHARHPHPISHNYYCVRPKQFNKDCRICYQDVKTEYGSYTCLKQDCNYIVHVNCATKDNDFYNEINEDKARELIENGEFLSESCITCVITKNESGEALEIKHAFHEHSLLLEEKIRQEEEDYAEKQCDGCVQSISTSFYYCSQCRFFLHKSCAELPVAIYHWNWLNPLTLIKSDGIFKCDFDMIGHDCSGFFYYESEEDTSVCLQCARIGDTLVHPGHQHFLFIDYQYEGKCNACDEEIYCGYRCKDGEFALHLTCATVPYTVRHKFDKHVLYLSYHDEDDPTRNYCDICEEERNPNLWFYHCSICDNAAHPKCAVGEYPRIKTGSTYKDEDLHSHPLTFVRKVYSYPKCHICGDPCVDLVAECVTCNFIVHRKCIENLNYS